MFGLVVDSACFVKAAMFGLVVDSACFIKAAVRRILILTVF
jgi:hypothetical protein